MELTVNDVRLKGCGFTLYSAARKKNVPGELVQLWLVTAYKKLGLRSENLLEVQKIQKQNPKIPDIMSVTDFGKNEKELEKMFEFDLISKKDDKIHLEKIAIEIFKDAAKIQKELDEKGFFYYTHHVKN